MKKVVIKTADNLSREAYEYICNGFKKMFAEELEFERIIDKSIIGGFIAQSGGIIYDMSVKSQLEKMKKFIKNA